MHPRPLHCCRSRVRDKLVAVVLVVIAVMVVVAAYTRVTFHEPLSLTNASARRPRVVFSTAPRRRRVRSHRQGRKEESVPVPGNTVAWMQMHVRSSWCHQHVSPIRSGRLPRRLPWPDAMRFPWAQRAALTRRGNARYTRIMFLYESRESGDTSRYKVESWLAGTRLYAR